MTVGFGFGFTGDQSLQLAEGGASFGLSIPAVTNGTALLDYAAVPVEAAGSFSVSSSLVSGLATNSTYFAAGVFVFRGSIDVDSSAKQKTELDALGAFVMPAGALEGDAWILDTVDVPVSRVIDVEPIDRIILVIGDED